MAKTKTKKEKIVDLTPKPEKITGEHLGNLQNTVRTMDRLTAELGRMDLQKYAVLKSLDRVQVEIDKLRTEFIHEYGTDNINIVDGTIGYPEEQTTPEDNGEADKKD